MGRPNLCIDCTSCRVGDLRPSLGLFVRRPANMGLRLTEKDLKRVDYAGQCWWCGSAADSREHRFKRADLLREYGRGPYTGDNAIVRGREDRLTPVQGPNSRAVKFRPDLCQSCNTSRSQPFDRAYDGFIDYAVANEQRIQKTSSIQLSDVYGRNWRRARYDLVRYYVKHICCRLAEASIEVSPGLRAFLDGRRRLPGLIFAWSFARTLWPSSNTAQPLVWTPAAFGWGTSRA